MKNFKLANFILWMVILLTANNCIFAKDVDVVPPDGEFIIENAVLEDDVYITSESELILNITATDNKTAPENLKMIVSSSPATEAQLLNGAWTAYKSTTTLSLGAGSRHTVYVYLKDEAGNIATNSKTASIEYMVTYVAEGAVNVPGAQRVKLGQAFNTAAKEPKRTDKYFLGWSKTNGAAEATWGSNDIVEASNIKGNMTLYAVWTNEARNLADVVEVGDFVEYPVEYENVGTQKLTGWRVLDITDGVVKLISAGTPLTYTKKSSAYADLTTNFLETTISDYESYGFAEAPNKMFKNLYTTKVESIKESDVIKLTGESNILNLDVSNYGGTLNNGTDYIIPGENNVYYKNGDNGIIEAAENTTYGVRIVVTLTPNIFTTDKNLTGMNDIKVPTYKITYEANGGIFTSTNKTKYQIEVVEGGKYIGIEDTLPKVTREGYKFLGWYTATTGGEQITESTIVNNITADRAVFAKWEAIPAVAIYQAGNTTLTFLKPENGIKVGDIYNGYAVTKVYTGIEEDTYAANTDVPWYEHAGTITKAVVADKISPVSTARWFDRVTNLASVDLEKLDTSKVTTMKCMFQLCSKLTTIDMTGWNTSNVTDMSFIFNKCGGLTSLDVSGFNTSKAITMSGMFGECSKLTTLDVSGFVTNNVTDMSYMFTGNSGLTSLDVSGFDTSKVTNMGTMFENCSNLTRLDVSGFNTVNVTDMQNMFYGCSGLTSLDVSGFDTSKVTNMECMFQECNNLTTLDVSGWNTVEVTNMYQMFVNCYKITKLDLTNFNTAKVTDVSYMFYGMHNLKEITIGANFSFKGTTVATGSLPTPSDEYITGADGKWYDVKTDIGYTPKALAELPSGEVRTFTAIPTIAQAIYLAEDTSLRFVKTKPLTTNDTYDGKAITAVYKGIEEDTYEASTDVPWYDIRESVTKVVVEDKIFPVATKRWFVNMKNLETADLTKLDTSQVTAMYGMFGNCSSLTSVDVSGFNTANVTEMHAMFQNCSKLTTLDVSNWDTSNVTDMAYMFRKCSGITSLDVSGWDTSKVTTTFSMFYNCGNLTTLDVSGWKTGNVTDMSFMFCGDDVEIALGRLDVSGWDTSKVTNMTTMFQNCTNLTTLDVSGWDTSNVTDMSYMFNKCRAITTLDVSGWDTSKVTTMLAMFQNCVNLTTLDVSEWDTSNVTNMESVFNLCRAITTLDVSGWDTSNVTDMSWMFSMCRALTTLDVSGWDTAKVTNMSYMFNECNALTSLDLTNFNTAKVTDMAYMFDNDYNLKQITLGANFTFKGTTPATGSLPTPSNAHIAGATGKWYDVKTGAEYTAEEVSEQASGTRRTYAAVQEFAQAIYIAEDTSLRFVKTSMLKAGDTYDDKTITAVYTGIEVDTYEERANVPWDSIRGTITKVVVEDNIQPVATKRWFAGMTNLASVDLAKLDTSKAKTTMAMFANCSSLTSVDVSGFITSNVTNMGSMFQGCKNLIMLDLSNWDTSNVTDMSYMFASSDDLGAMALQSINLSGWDTSKVTTMKAMFQKCSNLTTLDVSGFDTSNVTNMYHMFSNCSGLTNLDVSGWDTSKVTNMSGMFQACVSLTTLDVSGWDTSNVTDMSYMFNECSGLTSLDVTGFNTAKVTTMRTMFQNCANLTTLDLTNFNTAKVTDMTYMFYGMNNLKQITLGANFKFLSTAVTPETGSLPTPSNAHIAGATGKWYDVKTGAEYTAEEVSEQASGTARTYTAVQEFAQAIYIAEDTSLRFVKTSMLKAGDKYDNKVITNVYTGIEVDTYEANANVPWNEHVGTITTVIVEDEIKPVSTRRWFYGMTNLTTCDVTKLDTSKVKTMWGMFSICSSLKSVDVSEFNTSKVTDMTAMFQVCTSLTELDLSKWDVKNVTSMQNMFLSTKSDGDMKLISIGDISNWNTGNVKNMQSMFQRCSSIKTLNVANWNVSNVETMKYMFQNCTKLTTLDVSNWNTANVTDMSHMFSGCEALTYLDLSNFNTAKVTDMTYMFYGMNNLKQITLGANFKFLSTAVTPETGSLPTPSNAHIAGATGKWYDVKTGAEYTAKQVSEQASGTARTYAAVQEFAQALYIAEDTSLRFVKTSMLKAGDKYDNKVITDVYTGIEVDTYEANTDVPWYEHAGTITTVIVEDEISPVSTRRWFSGFTNATTIDVDNLDTRKAKDISYMFYDCAKVTTLEVGHFVTDNVTSMRSTFDGCQKVATLDVSNWNTSKVTTMRCMFQWCYALKTVDVSNWDTGNVTEMRSMFSGSKEMALESLDVSRWNTSNVTDMWGTFSYCSNLKSLDVSNWDTSKVTTMRTMFQVCTKLTTLDVSDWDTSNVEDMYHMFSSANSVMALTSLDVSGWDTSKVTTMRTMFQNCANLISLDVSGWDTSNVTDMGYMFGWCSGLTNLDVSGWDTSKVTYMDAMFQNCVNLTTLDLTNFNTDKVTDATDMFFGMNNLEQITLGANFTFKGTTVATGSLPTPSSTYVTGADGKWYDLSTNIGYEAAAVKTGKKVTYSAVRYTVTFNPNGGSVTPTTIKVSPGGVYGELPTPTRAGYEFLGWYDAAPNDTIAIKATDKYAYTVDMEFFAKWKGSVKAEFMDLIPSIANEPVLDEEKMQAIYWANNLGTTDETPIAKHEAGVTYNYTIGNGIDDTKQNRWANAITKEDGSYWVWIPRYAYKITYTDSGKTTVSGETTSTEEINGTKTQYGDIDILFMYGTSEDEYRDIYGNPQPLPDGYKVHPAFQAMSTEEDLATNPLGKWDEDLEGIWVAKYEAGRETSTNNWSTYTDGGGGSNTLTTNAGNASATLSRLVSKPSVKAWRGISLSNIYQNSLKMHEDLNSHFIKNSEWGAVAYLAHSAYGRNGNEIGVNQCSNYYTGAGPAGTADVYDSSTYTYSAETFVDGFAWNTEQGKKASTTGNIYGIYDMSGGTFESVAAYVVGGNATNISGDSYGGELGRTNDLKTKQIYAGTTSSSGSNYAANSGVYGDAVYEISTAASGATGWNGDSASFPYTGNPFFERGDYYRNNSQAGIFHFKFYNGANNADYGYRPVLSVKSTSGTQGGQPSHSGGSD